ncbi:EamA family transporter [Pararhizobium mangrovi]|uniref:EamA domain-containing protein n=1 Tax=Pararhizobium mangrovi TaxID=2590452 RepID=A0A506TUL0_9HYPH|nr:hypothetical protein [Pararhizobium mangrovi]TPW25742.1 hypothetical protein FJU11_18070 [Pararhizobium mangrovi]
MNPTAFAIVAGAAVCHAIWNAMVKAGRDRAVTLAAISFSNFLVGAVLVFFAPLPAAQSWPLLLASALLHNGYYIGLNYAYRFGDLSQVYPLARGMAPALVAIAAYLTIGEVLPVEAIVGLALVSVGIALLCFSRSATPRDPRALAAAAATGTIIAAYSLADGIGARLSDAPLGYISWLFLLEFPTAATTLIRRRHAIRAAAGSALAGLVPGFLSVLAYGGVIYAATIAPLAVVSALRETSVVLAALFGIFLFGERPIGLRLVSAVVVLSGIIFIATA